jgi:hypothetical protein
MVDPAPMQSLLATHLGDCTMSESKADRVHDLIVAGFRELGADGPERITRNVLFRDLFFVGQRFLCGNIQAVLLADEDEITFYDGQGTLLKTAMLIEQPLKKAA